MFILQKILLTCTRWPKRSISLCAASPSRCTKYFSPSPTIFTPVCVYVPHLDAALRAGVNDLLHAGDQHLDTLQPEPLLAGPLLSQEVLKPDGSELFCEEKIFLVLQKISVDLVILASSSLFSSLSSCSDPGVSSFCRNKG